MIGFEIFRLELKYMVIDLGGKSLRYMNFVYLLIKYLNYGIKVIFYGFDILMYFC